MITYLNNLFQFYHWHVWFHKKIIEFAINCFNHNTEACIFFSFNRAKRIHIFCETELAQPLLLYFPQIICSSTYELSNLIQFGAVLFAGFNLKVTHFGANKSHQNNPAEGKKFNKKSYI